MFTNGHGLGYLLKLISGCLWVNFMVKRHIFSNRAEIGRHLLPYLLAKGKPVGGAVIGSHGNCRQIENTNGNSENKAVFNVATCHWFVLPQIEP
ncbi:MAG: hypothetical protein BWY09_02139 [Candidatus Hydrogenedentes bacterium ADurb.Bin179]|nr:MAG: hypothetical protein BWY09_02139 [Candidatus Hydrogenedentes bacterium ADurb.Bin179]